MQLYHNNYSENKNAIITVRNTGFNWFYEIAVIEFQTNSFEVILRSFNSLVIDTAYDCDC
jgi:hypothetical protein